jgi:hypothetical protein
MGLLMLCIVLLTLIVAGALVGCARMLAFRLMQAVQDASRKGVPALGLHEAYDLGFADGRRDQWSRRSIVLRSWDPSQVKYYDQGHADGERTRR